jgi:DNA-binding GntR family transcriptional regulator
MINNDSGLHAVREASVYADHPSAGFMMMDSSADRPLYKQLADVIRAQIESGELIPGQRLPPETDYMQRYDISRDSVRRALAVVRGEGLIITKRHGSYVRDRRAFTAVHVDQGTISARMPTDPERRAMRIDEGVPILVITRHGQPEELHPADRTEIVAHVKSADGRRHP